MNEDTASIYQQLASSLLRHGLTAVGTYAVSRGYIDADTATALVGVGLTLGGLGWSALDKLTRKPKAG